MTQDLKFPNYVEEHDSGPTGYVSVTNDPEYTDPDRVLIGLSRHGEYNNIVLEADHAEALAYAILARAEAARDEAGKRRTFPDTLHAVWSAAREKDVPIAGLSWSGFNLIGDAKSVGEVYRLLSVEARAKVVEKAFEDYRHACHTPPAQVVETPKPRPKSRDGHRAS
jgi:hypothetical protein